MYNVLGCNYAPLRVATAERRCKPSPTNEQHTAAERATKPPCPKQSKPDTEHIGAAEVEHEECAEQTTVDVIGERIQHLPQQRVHRAVAKETVAELLSANTCQDGPQVLFELCKRRKRRRRGWRGGWTGRSGSQLGLVRQQARRRKRLKKRLSKGKCCRNIYVLYGRMSHKHT